MSSSNNKKLIDAKNRSKRGTNAGIIGIILNLFLVFSKLIAGYLSKSVAITADGLNNLSDIVSSLITFIGFKLSTKKPDKEHPFGHGRFEYISGLVVSILIIVMAYELTKSSIIRIINPGDVNYSLLSIVVLIISIMVKLFLMFYNYNLAKKINSSSLKAVGTDSRNDVISSSIVLISIIIYQFTKLNIDGWIGLIVALFIFYSGIELVKEMLNPLLGEAPDKKLVNAIHNKISKCDKITGYHDLLVHNYGHNEYFASVHVEMSSEIDAITAHNIIDEIENSLLSTHHINLSIHIDPVLEIEKKIK